MAVNRMSGRKKGVTDASVKEQRAAIGELARAYTKEALDALASVMINGQSEQARVAAATALLDRGYDRPPQAVTGDSVGE
jgi:hypothetical protein